MPEKNIFIVEDDESTLSIIKMQIENLGYNFVGSASTAPQAILNIREVHPDLILMDINLSGGFDGIHVAKAISHFLTIPVIFVTAHTDDATLERLKSVKVASVLNKPLSSNDLEAAISLVFETNNI